MKTFLILTLLSGHHVKVDLQWVYDIYTDGRIINAPNGHSYSCSTPGSMVYFKFKTPICVKEIVTRSIIWKIQK